MLNISQLREFIIVPALSKLNAYTKDAEELLVFTCAVESNLGSFIHQVKGPALGIYQCEPATYTDIWRNYIIHRSRLTSVLALNFGVGGLPPEDRLMWDWHYATAICRIHYLRVKEALPKREDVDGMWEYYKKYYNTEKGKSTKTKSIEAYKRATSP